MAKTNDDVTSIIIGLSASKSNREIQQILSSKGVKLSHVSIGKIIRENRAERAEQTKEVVNEHIKKTVTTDLEILQGIRDQLDEWRKDENLRVTERLMCIDRLNKVIDTRLKYSGAGDGNEKITLVVDEP